METADSDRLFTVGHSNLESEALLRLLSTAGVTALADVRSSPYSRRLPHFNRPYAHGFLDLPHPDFRFIGIDEQTALTNAFNGGWEVRGRGSVVIVEPDNRQTRYKSGEKLAL